jgi:hypothetical protein
VSLFIRNTVFKLLEGHDVVRSLTYGCCFCDRGPSVVLEWDSLRELDVRAAKKQVCKLPPELVTWLTERKCVIRGGVPQKAKGGKKK